MEPAEEPCLEFAHYYGSWIWNEELTAWVKSLLLFFDGIALALPADTANNLIESDPILAQPLMEQGLLRNFEPDLWLKLHNPKLEELYVEELRKSLDPSTDRIEVHLAQANVVLDLLQNRDELYRLMKLTWPYLNTSAQEDAQFSSYVRALAVGMTSKMLLQHITDVAIQPVINDGDAASFVTSVIGGPKSGRVKVITEDLALVGIDLSAVPLDEILDFRKEYGSEYRAYSKNVREFVLDLSLMPGRERLIAISERRADIDDRAAQLRHIGRDSFKRASISLGFGLVGAAWTLAHGDPWGAAFAAGATAAGFSRPDLGSIGAAYSYVLRAATELKR